MEYLTGAGRHAPPRLLLALAAAAASAGTASAEQRRSPQPAPVPAPAPAPLPPVDLLIMDKLVWSTMAAVDQANVTGNYSVLRDLGAPSFQANNSAATLGGIFEQLRRQRIDLSNALIVAPTYQAGTAVLPSGALRAKGVFALRPTAIAFDLIYQNVAGQWRLLGVSIAPVAWGNTATAPSGR